MFFFSSTWRQVQQQVQRQQQQAAGPAACSLQPPATSCSTDAGRLTPIRQRPVPSAHLRIPDGHALAVQHHLVHVLDKVLLLLLLQLGAGQDGRCLRRLRLLLLRGRALQRRAGGSLRLWQATGALL
jgi:hypothetical protein